MTDTRVAYSIAEAAATAGVSTETIRKAIRLRELLAYNPTKKTLVLHDDLVDWIRQIPAAARAS